jgi:hypothetical protein
VQASQKNLHVCIVGAEKTVLVLSLDDGRGDWSHQRMNRLRERVDIVRKKHRRQRNYVGP